jgi:hypothetical protein
VWWQWGAILDSVKAAAHCALRRMENRMSIGRVLASFGFVVAAASVQAADLPERVVINAPIRAENPCADPVVLGGIMDRFAWAETKTWRRGFVMAFLGNARDGNHPFDEPGLILRTYCVADSVMTDTTRRPVFYAIERGQGFASIGNYVDFCVEGLDPWRVHDEACRTVR